MKFTQTKQFSAYRPAATSGDPTDFAAQATHHAIFKIARRKHGPRYWRDLAGNLLTQGCRILSEREVAFLASVQHSAHRGVVPTQAQVSWIRNIQERMMENSHVS